MSTIDKQNAYVRSIYIEYNKPGLKQTHTDKRTRPVPSSSHNLAKKPLPPLATNGLKPTHHIATLSTSISVAEFPIPVASLQPPRSLLEALFLATQLGDEVAGGA